MGDEKSPSQWGWEPLVQDCKWDEVENWWEDQHLKHPDDPTPIRALLSELRRIVPSISVAHGMETIERHIQCQDGNEYWAGREKYKGAAKILELGELEAAVEGLPEEATQVWSEHRAKIEQRLAELAGEPEKTDGAPELSQTTHAKKASELLSHIDATTEWLCSELESKFDREWLREALAEIAFAAFHAGRHTQEAWGKEFEHHASARLRSIRAFANRNEGRTEHNRKIRQDRIAWEAHAQRVAETSMNGKLTKSARADFILRNWNRVDADGERPSPPSKKTIQNWLSGKEKVSRTRSSSGESKR